jgi:2,3-bisphosphoglycerate-dependent phosphoglycerate mutase
LKKEWLMALLVMLRHGQSQWNKENRFTGWVDIPLSQEGIEEAIEAGKQIADISFDIIFTSTLSRARTTLILAMAQNRCGKVPLILHPGEGRMESWARIYSEEAKATTIPVIQAWELNERMYGALQGCDKDETREKFGLEQVEEWRRSYDKPPPDGESLEDTAARTIPFFLREIVPHLQQGKNVFISAHGNSLRSIVMYIDKLGPDIVVKLEIATGVPLTYEFKDGLFRKL